MYSEGLTALINTSLREEIVASENCFPSGRRPQDPQNDYMPKFSIQTHLQRLLYDLQNQINSTKIIDVKAPRQMKSTKSLCRSPASALNDG